MMGTYHDDMRDQFKATDFEWCCKGRHGVIREVKKKGDSVKVNRMLQYFFGSKCATWRDTPGKSGYMDVEFVHMTKVFPPPKRPWEWCGKTILFETWQGREKMQRDAMARFKFGDKVSFEHKGIRYEGLVTGGRKRVTVMVGSDKWYIPPMDLVKI